MSDTEEMVKPITYGIRVAEWSEWLPLFGDEATEGQLRFANGASLVQCDPREKLVDVEVMSPGQRIERWIVMDDDGNQTILPEDAPEPSKEDQEAKKAVKGTFGLYVFQAVFASHADVGDEPPKPMLTSKLPRQEQPKITVAGAMPPNREMRRKR